MPFKKLTRWLREHTAPRVSRLLSVVPLEDRVTPSASLVDINNSFLGAGDRPANILGMSDNGRYILFESKATNLITGQQDIPDTNDLFWKDLQTGDTRMITALPGVAAAGYDYSVTRLAPQSFSFQAITDGQLLPSFNKAVISSDGTAVAFSSVTNAARLDDAVANVKYNPNSGNTVVTDLDNTLDVFRWNASDGQINLASRTLPQGGGGGGGGTGTVFAFGRFGGADTPAISRDGSYVGFVSQVDAGYTNDTDGFGSTDNFSMLDGGTTNDVFVTLFERDITNRISFLKSTVLSAVGAVFDSTNGTATDGDEGRTFGHGAGSTGVSVDPNGRYLSEDAAGNVSVVFMAPIEISTFGIFGGLGGARTISGNSEVFRVEVQAALTGDLTRFLITATDGKATGNNGVTKAGGNAQNAIVGVTNPNGVVVSTSVSGFAGVFNPSPQGPNPARQDLYYVRTDINSQAVNVLNTQRLPNVATSTTVADTTLYTISPNGKHVVWTQVEGVRPDGSDKTQVYYRQALPSVTPAVLVSVGLNGLPLSSGATFPRVSQNGRFVTFTSDTPANQVVSLGLQDTNNASDVFIRDLYFTTNAKGAFVANTRLLSINSAGTGAANGASSRGFVGTTLSEPENGLVPSSVNDSLGRTVFNSKATNIDAGFIPTHGGTSIFTQSLPIDGIPPTVPPTDAPRTGVVSGGREAGIANISFTGAGTVVFGPRLTPFPGFTGEIRVASADVNGDGVLDTIVGPGPGLAPRVIVFNGVNNARIADFFGYEATFTGGVTIAAADINGDNRAEVILGADKGGGARVRVLSGDRITTQGGFFSSFTPGDALVDFFAYSPEFRGGVRVATGDFNGDGVQDVLTGAGSGGGPRVSAFSGVGINGGLLTRFIDFFAMELNLRNGVFVAGGDMNNDGVDDIIVGAGAGGGPRVAVFESLSVATRPAAPDLLYNFFAGNVNSRAGIRVAVKNVDGDPVADIVTGEGFGKESRVRSFSGAKFASPLTPTEIPNTFVVFDDLTSLNGAWVG